MGEDQKINLSFFLPILPPIKLTITGRCVKHRERGEGVTRVHAGGNYKGGYKGGA